MLSLSSGGFGAGILGVGARASSTPTARLPIWRWSASMRSAGAVPIIGSGAAVV